MLLKMPQKLLKTAHYIELGSYQHWPVLITQRIRLYTYEQIPLFLKENPYITDGYRAHLPSKLCLRRWGRKLWNCLQFVFNVILLFGSWIKLWLVHGWRLCFFFSVVFSSCPMRLWTSGATFWGSCSSSLWGSTTSPQSCQLLERTERTTSSTPSACSASRWDRPAVLMLWKWLKLDF